MPPFLAPRFLAALGSTFLIPLSLRRSGKCPPAGAFREVLLWPARNMSPAAPVRSLWDRRRGPLAGWVPFSNRGSDQEPFRPWQVLSSEWHLDFACRWGFVAELDKEMILEGQMQKQSSFPSWVPFNPLLTILEVPFPPTNPPS